MAEDNHGKDKQFFKKLIEVDPLEARMQAQLRVGEDNSEKSKIANSVMSAKVQAVEAIRVAPGLKADREELLRIARQKDQLAAEVAKQDHLDSVHKVATQKPWYLPIPQSWWDYLNK